MDTQRVNHCSLCSLRFGLAERRYEFEGQVVHKEPCLTTLQHRANLRTERVVVSLGRRPYDNPCTS